VLSVTAVPGLSVVGYTAEPNSDAAQIIHKFVQEIEQTANIDASPPGDG
jgi:hypothetical protein